ncbi:helix-turn-helix domain-containing protein [Bosea beijingensis]
MRDVTPRRVRRHAVAPHQKLFGAEGRTFFDHVLERRLDRAWQRLVTAEAATLAISAVAYEVGFGGLSYFNRCFRKRFGRPPSQIKALAVSGET